MHYLAIKRRGASTEPKLLAEMGLKSNTQQETVAFFILGLDALGGKNNRFREIRFISNDRSKTEVCTKRRLDVASISFTITYYR